MRGLNTKIRLEFILTKLKCFRAYSTQVSQGQDLKNEAKKAQEIFTNATKTCDEMGAFTTFGQHNFWKDRIAQMAAPKEPGQKILDAAGGQGPIAIRLLNLIKNTPVEKDFHVTVCDINTSMMNFGKQLFAAQKLNPNLIDWVEGSIENLPFSNETFNVYVISMGLRSVHFDKTFSEAYRVLKPGGRFYCLDLSPIDNYCIASVHKFLFAKAMPYLAYKIWNTHEPFNYYIHVHATRPTKAKMIELIQDAGFSQVTYTTMFFGWGCIHSGYKP